MLYKELISNLEKRGFKPFYAESVQKGIDFIKKTIPKKSSIGFGGSATVIEMGLLEAMKEDYKLLHRSFYKEDYYAQLFQEMHTADWYISSTNALSEEGELINIDGRANRVAEILFGPKNILIVCGTNKIVKDMMEGISRTRNVSAPINAKKLNRKTPCAETGKCSYCMSPDTICKATVIQHHPTSGKNVYVLIINENLGY